VIPCEARAYHKARRPRRATFERSELCGAEHMAATLAANFAAMCAGGKPGERSEHRSPERAARVGVPGGLARRVAFSSHAACQPVGVSEAAGVRLGLLPAGRMTAA
jgi:hypothetical protein